MKEFYQWADYETLEPFGNYWLIQLSALLTARFFNVTRKGGKALDPEDLLPARPRSQRKISTGSRSQRKMSDSQIKNSLTMFAKLHNAAEKGRQ